MNNDGDADNDGGDATMITTVMLLMMRNSDKVAADNKDI